jgi:uroporphyrinogen-III decarboxylase
MEMTPRERALAAFEHESTDKVPIMHSGFSSRIASVILGREAYVGGGIQQWREAKALWQGGGAHREYLERSLRDAFEVAKAMDHDILRLQYWRMPERPTEKRDEHAFLYGDPKGEWRLMRFYPPAETYGVIEQHPPKEKLTFESIEKQLSEREEMLEDRSTELLQSFWEKMDVIETRIRMETFGREYAIQAGGGSICVPRDSTWLAATVRTPDLVARHLDIQAETAVRGIKKLAWTGAKLVLGGGDFAGNDGPFYSPKAFRDLMLPRLQRISEACHKYGMYYIFASDGNLWPVSDDLFGKSGVDGYLEIDRRAGMDLRKLRERFPDLTLMGNISSYTLSQGTRDEVIAETLSCLKEAKRSGGIIVGVSSFILPGTPKENLMAMTKTIRDNR